MESQDTSTTGKTDEKSSVQQVTQDDLARLREDVTKIANDIRMDLLNHFAEVAKSIRADVMEELNSSAAKDIGSIVENRLVNIEETVHQIVERGYQGLISYIAPHRADNYTPAPVKTGR